MTPQQTRDKIDDYIEEAREKRDAERTEVIAEQNHKTDRFKGLDLTDSTIGKANRQILQIDIEVAKKRANEYVITKVGTKRCFYALLVNRFNVLQR